MAQAKSGSKKAPAKKAGAKSEDGEEQGRSQAHDRQELGVAPAAAGRSDKSVQAFRDALDRSVTLSRDRLQEVVDDAVERGRMTRGDANELVSRLVTRGRQQTDDLMRDLEKLLEQARKEVETRVEPARKRATAPSSEPAAPPGTPPTSRWPRPTACAGAPARPGARSRPTTSSPPLR